MRSGVASHVTARVISYSLPEQWLRQGHLQVTVRGVGVPPDSRVRYLLIQPGDVLEGDTQVLEVPDPNGMLFAQARRTSSRPLAAAGGGVHRRTFAELIQR